MRNPYALILTAALTCASALAAGAQGWSPPSADPPAPEGGTPDGDQTSLFERGLENFMQNMLKEAEPHLDRLGRDLGDTMNSLRPVLGDIGNLMDDAKNYQAPERLENGDIVIRRRADAPPPPPVGDTLREMLRPAPEDDPRLNRRPGDREIPILPKAEPGTEIEL
ncbi:hypothetical protein [Paracoccus sp. (in: a-proteobacteria)]|uniref:hypothetical protein n=1 Tax=Paracoccus sp. TaxID=267 RepID=UPI003A89B8A2